MKTRQLFKNTSNLHKLIRLTPKNYRKIVHVHCMNCVSLIFYIQDSSKQWVPWTGTEYINFGFNIGKLPNFIKRHLNVEKIQELYNREASGESFPWGHYFENGKLVTIENGQINEN
jgi:hypothetical protein